MKRKLHAILLMLLCLLFVLLPCSSLAQTEEEEPQFYDALHVAPEVFELIGAKPNDQIIHSYKHPYSYEDGYYLSAKNAHTTHKDVGYFFVISAEDGHVEWWRKGSPLSEMYKYKAYPSVEESPVALLMDFLENQQKYLKREVQIKELYFSVNIPSLTTGTYLYIVTDQGHFMIYQDPLATPADPTYVFPQKDFEKLEQMYSKARKEVGFIMGGSDSDFYFTRLLERKTDVDLTKYHTPFDIDRYNQELAFKNTIKTALPIAGAVAVGVVIVVLVVVIAVSKKDGTDEPSQAPAESADPDQD